MTKEIKQNIEEKTKQVIRNEFLRIKNMFQDRIDSEELRVKSLASQISTREFLSESSLREVEEYRKSIKELEMRKSLISEILVEIMDLDLNFEK